MDVIESENLFEKSIDVGKLLVKELETLERYGVANIRGLDTGTFIAFDVPQRDRVVKDMQENNVIVGPASTQSIRLRPSLILDENHVGEFIECLKSVLIKL